MVKDMTVGNPTKLMLAFSIPMLIGNIFQQFYSMVDTIIVGRYVSVEALAAVGATGGMTFLVLGFVMGITNGFSVLVAQRFGANDERGMKKTVAMSIYLGIFFTIAITLISVITAKPLLHMVKTPDDIINDSYTYLLIIYLGIVVTVAYNLLGGILRALGDSKTPLYFLIVASILNVILDLIFIINFNLGVAGAALATVLAQAISAILCYLYIKKKFPILKLRKSDFQHDRELIRELLRISLPMGLQYSVTAIGVVILQGAVNSFGSTVVAAYTAAIKVEILVTQPGSTLGMAMSTFAAQNLGAGKLDRVKVGIKKCIMISTIINIIGGVFVLVFGNQVVGLFITENVTEVVGIARQYLVPVAFSFWILGLLFIYRSTLQGLGNSKVPMWSGFTELVVRLGIAVILSNVIGFNAICLASPLAWISATILLYISYNKEVKKLDLL